MFTITKTHKLFFSGCRQESNGIFSGNTPDNTFIRITIRECTCLMKIFKNIFQIFFFVYLQSFRKYYKYTKTVSQLARTNSVYSKTNRAAACRRVSNFTKTAGKHVCYTLLSFRFDTLARQKRITFSGTITGLRFKIYFRTRAADFLLFHRSDVHRIRRTSRTYCLPPC